MIGYIVVGTGVPDGPLQTVRIAENFVKWTVEDAGPYNFCAVCLEHAVPFAVTVWAGRRGADPYRLMQTAHSPTKCLATSPQLYHACALIAIRFTNYSSFSAK